jgi:hypothetical protein
VISGVWYCGYGLVAGAAAEKALPAGSFYAEPGGFSRPTNRVYCAARPSCWWTEPPRLFAMKSMNTRAYAVEEIDGRDVWHKVLDRSETLHRPSRDICALLLVSPPNP